MTLLGSLQPDVNVIPDNESNQQEIEEFGIPCPPEGRWYNNRDGCLFIAPYTIIIGGFHTEGIGTCRQVGVGGACLVAYVVPLFVISFEHIGILVLFR